MDLVFPLIIAIGAPQLLGFQVALSRAESAKTVSYGCAIGVSSLSWVGLMAALLAVTGAGHEGIGLVLVPRLTAIGLAVHASLALGVVYCVRFNARRQQSDEAA